MTYIIVFILSTCIFTTYGIFTSPPDCGINRFNNEFREENSSIAQVGEFPWLARLGLFDIATTSNFFFCTGSLIHPLYVITAAHCGQMAEFVTLGVNNLGDNSHHQEISIVGHLFADHCRLSNTNDLSILILEKEAIISDFVRPICLFMDKQLEVDDIVNTTMTLAGWQVIYSGWGTLHGETWTEVKDLKYNQPPILHPDECSKFYVQVEENMICVGYARGAKYPCVVDSGGPLMMYKTEDGIEKAYLAGVASHDLFMCQKKQMGPNIFTDVSFFGSWIERRIELWEEHNQ